MSVTVHTVNPYSCNCIKIPYRNYEISISVDSRYGTSRTLVKTELIVFDKDDENITDYLDGLLPSNITVNHKIIYGINGETLRAVFTAIDDYLLHIR